MTLGDMMEKKKYLVVLLKTYHQSETFRIEGFLLQILNPNKSNALISLQESNFEVDQNLEN